MRLELAAVPSEKKYYKLRALIKRETQFFFIYSLSSLKKMDRKTKNEEKKKRKTKIKYNGNWNGVETVLFGNLYFRFKAKN